MRVLAVGNMYPPHHFGGYELVWQDAMRHAESCGASVRVLTTDFRLPDVAEREDANVRRELRWYWRDHEFPPLGGIARLQLERHNARVLDQELDDVLPDVVSWWSMGGMSLSLIERVRRRGIPAVAFVHDDWLVYGPKVDAWTRAFRGRLRPWASAAERCTGIPTRVSLDNAARCVFVSETTRRLAADRGIPFGQSEVAHSGIDSSLIEPATERAWRWSLLYVGRLDQRKGIETAIRALAELPAEARLTVAGGGDQRENARLNAIARGAGVAERVRFRGALGSADIRAAYDESDVVVFPVVWNEPWGLVPLEAMARGRPVVATGRGGSGEYLREGHNALLFDAGDHAALAAAVGRLAADPDLRSRLRAGGIKTALAHTSNRFNEKALRELEAAAAK